MCVCVCASGEFSTLVFGFLVEEPYENCISNMWYICGAVWESRAVQVHCNQNEAQVLIYCIRNVIIYMPCSI